MTYAFLNFPTNDLTESEVRLEVVKAFKFWSDVTPLTFTESMKTEGPDQADIRIGFYSGAHLNDPPFDGLFGVAAHAHYPSVPPHDMSGDVHFDDEDFWSTKYGNEKAALSQ